MNQLFRNIDLVVIPIKAGTADYFLPKNVDWAAKPIDKIVICAPSVSGELSPIDGITPVMTYADVLAADLYIDLYSASEETICHGLHVSNMMHNNNYSLTIGQTISRDLSQLHFANAPVQDACLLLYVFTDTKEDLDAEPSKKNITLRFPMAANERLTMRYVINTYVHAPGEKVRGISMYNPYNAPTYLTLRDHELTYFINSVHSELMRPDLYGAGGAPDTQLQPFLLDCLDVDFDHSFIQNASANPIDVVMTIEY